MLRYEDSRTVYFISPKYLLEDVKRCFAKLGLDVNMFKETEKQWILKGFKPNVSVQFRLPMKGKL